MKIEVEITIKGTIDYDGDYCGDDCEHNQSGFSFQPECTLFGHVLGCEYVKNKNYRCAQCIKATKGE